MNNEHWTFMILHTHILLVFELTHFIYSLPIYYEHFDDNVDADDNGILFVFACFGDVKKKSIWH